MFEKKNKVLFEKRLSTVHPELVKYFENPEDADYLSYGSSNKVEMKCPDCGVYKMHSPYALKTQGFACNYCSDGVSMPNKLTFGVLLQSGVDFECEKSFTWSQKKRYDFYIEMLKLLIEVHGKQHYEEWNLGRSLKEEQENDKLKYDLAIQNGFNFCEINASSTDFQTLQTSIVESLNNFIYLPDINWEIIYERCSKSEMIHAWELYNIGMEMDEISNELKMNEGTIRKYLQKGGEIGMVSFKPSASSMEVVQYDLNGNAICKYKNYTEAQSKTGVGSSSINRCCLGHIETAGGYKWELKPKQSVSILNKPNIKIRIERYIDDFAHFLFFDKREDDNIFNYMTEKGIKFKEDKNISDIYDAIRKIFTREIGQSRTEVEIGALGKFLCDIIIQKEIYTETDNRSKLINEISENRRNKILDSTLKIMNMTELNFMSDILS